MILSLKFDRYNYFDVVYLLGYFKFTGHITIWLHIALNLLGPSNEVLCSWVPLELLTNFI